MMVHPNFDPVALQIGPLAVRWYGLMYLLGFVCGWWLGRQRARGPESNWTPEQVNDLVFYIALGVVLGGRLGYVLFYNFQGLLLDPLMVLRVWQGGMSFHGGLLGVLIAMALFGRRHRMAFFTVTDFIAPLIPPGLGFGRLGNFINGELWGRVTEVPWGMVFTSYRAGDLPRHPSQLYQALLEGVVLFAILWWFSGRPRPMMAVSGSFLVGYAAFRMVAEFFREPDQHLGFVAFDWMTMGQLLSVPMLLAGLAMMIWAYRRAR